MRRSPCPRELVLADRNPMGIILLSFHLFACITLCSLRCRVNSMMALRRAIIGHHIIRMYALFLVNHVRFAVTDRCMLIFIVDSVNTICLLFLMMGYTVRALADWHWSICLRRRWKQSINHTLSQYDSWTVKLDINGFRPCWVGNIECTVHACSVEDCQ